MLRSPVDKIESDKRAVEAGCAQVHAVGSLVDAQSLMGVYGFMVAVMVDGHCWG